MFHARQQIGLYTLIRKLGEGGFGEVWLAENRSNSPSEKVAVKLPRKDQVDLQAVKDEIFNWILSGKHKNILPIIECETFNNQIAIVSEYAPDGSLQDLINRKSALPVAEAIEIAVGILDGLTHLHNRKIIHRDLKPDNVLFQGNVPRLTDFGISRAMTVTSQSQTVSGTLSYMAPEAFDGKRNAQTDIWAVGVILYQLLTGNLPFPQKEMIELVGALARQDPAPLPASIPPDLQPIVKKALAKESSERYKTAAEMAKELGEFSQKNSEETLKMLLAEETLRFPSNEPLPTEPLPIIENSVSTIPKFIVAELKESPETNKSRINNLSVPFPTKSKRFYFTIPTVILLLFLIIGGGYWLKYKQTDDSITSTNNNSIPSASKNNNPVTSPTTTPLKDETGQTVLIPFRKGDKWGFSDSAKNLIIPPKYNNAYSFKEGLARIGLNGMGFIDKTGKEIIPPRYDYARDFKEGLARVQLNKNYGFIDKTGKEIIPLKYYAYDYEYDFSDGLTIVQFKRRYGFIDKTGKEIVPPKYDVDEFYAYSFSEGFAVVKLNGKYGFIDQTGKEIVSPKYDDALSFSKGLALVKSNGRYGFVDKTGKVVISLKYNDVEHYTNGFSEEGLARVKLNGKYGFIDQTEKEIIPPKYDDARSFSEGLAFIKSNGKWGLIDKTGKEIIPPKYDVVYNFKEGLAYVKLNNKWGFIDQTGKEIIPLRYDNVSNDPNYFSEGLARVKLNGKEFYIDKNGTEYYEP